MDTRDGVRLDLIFSMTPMEDDAIRRSVVRTIGGQQIQVCTPEDLILFKIGSEREKDRQDAEQIARQNVSSLDRTYLDPRIKQLGEGLSRPDILTDYLSWFRSET